MKKNVISELWQKPVYVKKFPISCYAGLLFIAAILKSSNLFPDSIVRIPLIVAIVTAPVTLAVFALNLYRLVKYERRDFSRLFLKIGSDEELKEVQSSFGSQSIAEINAESARIAKDKTYTDFYTSLVIACLQALIIILLLC